MAMTMSSSPAVATIARVRKAAVLAAAVNRSPVLNSLLAGKMQGIFANLNQIRRKVYG